MEKEYLEKIKQYLLQKNKLDSNFNNHSKIYSMTTENIAGFLNNYNLRDKHILTVAGSGDQRINSYMLGAKNVTCFDINPLTKLQLELKDKALTIINYEKFIKFFGIEARRYGNYYKPLDKRIFDEFKNKLDHETYSFFNYIINEKEFIGFNDIYHSFDNNLDLLKNMNNYLTKDDYEIAKKIMGNKEIDFIESDINDLPYKLKDNKYDLILLSNISDYIHLMYNHNSLSSYRDLIDELINHLNLYGTIQVGYIYASYHKESDVSNFHIKEKREKYFPTRMFHTMMVDSFYDNGEKDKVITFQKL